MATIGNICGWILPACRSIKNNFDFIVHQSLLTLSISTPKLLPMLPIKPHLWFSQDAKQAAEFYASFMPDAAVNYANHFPSPDGECKVVEFTIAGQSFFGISSAHQLGINPSISFMVHFNPSHHANAAQNIDEIWNKLIENGKIMMPLDSYPFSKRYGWVEDQYGVSWQLMLTNPDGEERPVIVPSLLFTEPVAGKADEAINFY